ncbi:MULTISPECIES: TetR/AcrR family transcriptional regulator [Mycobacterium avium complex (MAC)]|uniref:TetR family transcriptional regulator n=5 Tax=Mycobacterium avium complex (MAC) TaxID=120793 RepID=A0ABX3TLX6_9MYCO|nr:MULTISPECIES: TetR/AcrR family transcriptional regulator [Mycobacterium avium complex (MAC)]EUA39406.1 bacterial regulatory s, tetR family protein [Mycobacterium avium subsp. avium 2285 (R)]APT10930.1 TetR family transcriptional regulator [Mycobacterium avium subsp. hominissuis]MBZ4507313.1 TetR/AcrR family transcriptional regulator [Mycobacterium avium subsp. hominissuis]MBZ4512357.1 TetR/AcrR family transcriptional regulator [Mycobacterium avium subsp. hominissuis]MBZ4516412.1 TetR/AcrR f
MNAPRTRRREKVGPDPAVRRAILDAASTTLRRQGVDGLSIAAVLSRASLSTRAFYRHFGSKDELVAAVFLEHARAEKRRLRRRMTGAASEAEAVAAWIDGRLDLAFDDRIGNDLRRLSLEAQSQAMGPAELIQPAYAEMLEPLRDALQRGSQNGVFHDVDPVTQAQFIHGVVWTGIARQWASGDCDRDDLRRRVQRFCLRGLGIADEVIDRVCFVMERG